MDLDYTEGLKKKKKVKRNWGRAVKADRVRGFDGLSVKQNSIEGDLLSSSFSRLLG